MGSDEFDIRAKRFFGSVLQELPLHVSIKVSRSF